MTTYTKADMDKAIADAIAAKEASLTKMTAAYNQLKSAADTIKDQKAQADDYIKQLEKETKVLAVDKADLQNQLKTVRRSNMSGVSSPGTPNVFSTPVRTNSTTLASGSSAGGATHARPLPATLVFHGKENEDYVSFRDKFATAVELNAYTDAQAKLGLKLCMKDSAARAVAVIDHRDDNNTVDDVLKQYDALFLNPAASELAVTKFEQAVQQAKEDVLQFHSRVGALFLRAHPHLQHEPAIAIRVFSNGLRKIKIKEAVMRASPKTYSEALTAAQIEQSVYERVYPAAVDGAFGYDGPSSKNSSDTRDTVNEVTASTECYGCGKRGHIKAYCPRSSPRATARAVAKMSSSNNNRTRSTSRDRKPRFFKSKRSGKLYRRVSAIDGDNGEDDEDLEELEEVDVEETDTRFEEEPSDGDEGDLEEVEESEQDFPDG